MVLTDITMGTIAHTKKIHAHILFYDDDGDDRFLLIFEIHQKLARVGISEKQRRRYSIFKRILGKREK